MDVSTPGLTSEDSGIGSKSSGKPDEDKSSRKIAGLMDTVNIEGSIMGLAQRSSL